MANGRLLFLALVYKLVMFQIALLCLGTSVVWLSKIQGKREWNGIVND